MMRPALLALGALVTAIALECRPSVESSEVWLYSAPVVVTDDAILRIAGATCGREVGCGNVGSERRFPDAAACTVATAGAVDAEIGKATCPSGVSERSLALCLSDLRDLVCAIRLQAPSQLVSCRRSELCGVDIRR